MPVIVVTRLRLRDPALMDESFTDAVAAIEQAVKSEGNLGADAHADVNNAWWSVSAWRERRLMQAYVDSEPHLGINAPLRPPFSVSPYIFLALTSCRGPEPV